MNKIKKYTLIPNLSNTISGREYGEKIAIDFDVLENIKADNITEIKIPNQIIAINDSFWKGLFTESFKILKSKEKVKSFFKFDANLYYQNSIDKNLTILEAIQNQLINQ